MTGHTHVLADIIIPKGKKDTIIMIGRHDRLKQSTTVLSGKSTDIIRGDGSVGPATTGIPSIPPAGQFAVTNLYVNPDTGRTTVEYDNTPGAASGIVPSNPPAGYFAVTNIYIDTPTGRLAVEYDDEPV